ncbi:hypothetical protein [Paenibacillus nanensis]|uniref:hypothetical protein n=1 Tax=Paenibacillus nanensis TaxID=393251 RepID=UPI0011C45856|nr:hypothetical protein [Paenibacillus nanensis]
MFELELHEWLPYLLSIGWICAAAGIYTMNLHGSGELDRFRPQETGLLPVNERSSVEIALTIRKRLVRFVKRKEAPDEDNESDCAASLEKSKPNQRGGLLCQRKFIILPARRTGLDLYSLPLPL